MRPHALLLALVALGVLLTGCDSVAPSLACKVDVDSPDLVKDREAAGIADCDFETDTTAPAADLPDLALDCLGGTTSRSLAEVRGPALLNFWASNCGPCRKELPVLQEFHEKYGDQVAVLGVDYLETYPGAAIDLARQSGVTYPSLADACGDLQETDLVVQGLPQFVFVDAGGEIQQSAGGVDSLKELVALVDQHLGIDVTATTPDETAQEGAR
ncbi:TlpA disulfide reductase family protein [Nocardioides sp. WS12]|uniref:TlpA family protein disulfide reductase n=1 Tax=Nocardioides sp. WS12 TaxID=2486272 RepID=UPI0015F88D0D|nr:TlpA disulfide reductase family protein [Nocardioides sp. WS12]